LKKFWKSSDEKIALSLSNGRFFRWLYFL